MDKYRETVREFTGVSDFYVWDTETTGLKHTDDRIIEFSAVHYEKNGSREYENTGEIDIYINPGIPVPEIITELTGITDDVIRTEGLPEKVASEKIREFLGENPNLMGYNSVSFDEPFLNDLYIRNFGERFTCNTHIDVLKMAREKVPGPHKLADMAEKAGLSGITFHRSIDDAKATYGVYKYLIPMYDQAEEPAEFLITGVKRWKFNDTLDRIYVNNKGNASVYYDVVSGVWHIGCNTPDEDVVSAVLSFTGCMDTEELQKKIS